MVRPDFFQIRSGRKENNTRASLDQVATSSHLLKNINTRSSLDPVVTSLHLVKKVL
jgi:hypothetical protein